MITAVDTSVLLDVFGGDPAFLERSLSALRRTLADGPLVACDVVWAEVIAAFGDPATATRALGRIPVDFSASASEAAAAAGSAWRGYRAGGGPRTRVVADFLVGAHALEQADRLLTRDRGFHRTAFKGLAIVDPTD